MRNLFLQSLSLSCVYVAPVSNKSGDELVLNPQVLYGDCSLNEGSRVFSDDAAGQQEPGTTMTTATTATAGRLVPSSGTIMCWERLSTAATG